ncbi:MAG TPA: hypothetical protein EYP90_00570, partial [Chromatiaceae bacterium]|nr:hypothetical protein [Chromatiaceae bacterium]
MNGTSRPARKGCAAGGFLIGSLLLFILLSPAFASSITLDEKEEFGQSRWGVIPYAFSTDALGTGIGIGSFVSGVHQPQSSLGITGFKTDNDSWLLAGTLYNHRFDLLERWFFDIYLQFSRFTDQRFYDSPDRSAPDSPGSNDSREDDFLSGVSNDRHVEFTLRYVLPIGAGKENPLTIYRTRR